MTKNSFKGHPRAAELAPLDEQLQKVRTARRRTAARLDKARDDLTRLQGEEQQLMQQMVRLLHGSGAPAPA